MRCDDMTRLARGMIYTCHSHRITWCNIVVTVFKCMDVCMDVCVYGCEWMYGCMPCMRVCMCVDVRSRIHVQAWSILLLDAPSQYTRFLSPWFEYLSQHTLNTRLTRDQWEQFVPFTLQIVADTGNYSESCHVVSCRVI